MNITDTATNPTATVNLTAADSALGGTDTTAAASKPAKPARKAVKKAVKKATKARSVGRPEVPVTIPSRGVFTLKDLKDANPSVKPVTIRAHVIRGLAEGVITKLPKNVVTGRKGKPAHRFVNTRAYEAQRAKDARRRDTVVAA